MSALADAKAPESTLRDLPFMGVIHVVVEAMKFGYDPFDPSWSNLGQGMPEVGPIEGAPPRVEAIRLEPSDHAYGPVEGLPAMREAVAAHYNRLYRRGKASQYAAENVSICAGGRTTLTRVMAALDRVRLGYFIPDYTAYEDMLTTYQRVEPVLIELKPEAGFAIDPEELAARIERERLGAVLVSNPCNPTGRVIAGEELGAWVAIARERGTTLLMDEYYSHFIYKPGFEGGPISAAAHVEDVNEEPVVIVDGLTKCFRYPGWRLGWAVGPKAMIRTLTAAGSFCDGGPPRPTQRAAMEVLEPARADQETNAVRAVFRKKRDAMVERLKAMGVTLPVESQATFYAFGSVADLPPPLNDGRAFLRESLKNKVLTVPGEFFDVNPYRRRPAPSPLAPFVRFSFGPPMENMLAGLGRLGGMVKAAG
jgi:hypothetical protein